MNRFIVNLSVVIILVFSLSYSLCAFASHLLVHQALKLEKRENFAESINYLSLASKVNPLNSESYSQRARLLHTKGLKENKMACFKESLNLLFQAKKLHSNNLNADLMIVEVQNLLGSPPMKVFDDLKILNRNYPGSLKVEKYLVEQGIKVWGILNADNRGLVLETLIPLLKYQSRENIEKLELLRNQMTSMPEEAKWQMLQELKIFNQKKPDNYIAEKFLVETGINFWERFSPQEKEFFIEKTFHLLSCKYWLNLNVIDLFLEKTKDFEIIKKITPNNIRVFDYINSILSKYNARIDYFWLKQKYSEIQKVNNPERYNSKLEERKQKISEIKQKWNEKFRSSVSSVINENFIGWYDNTKEIIKGNIYGNGSIYGVVALKRNFKSVVIKAKSTKAYDIPAYMLVSINENVLGGVYVDNADFQVYSFPIKDRYEGEVVISISFENDCFDRLKNQDRNLYVSSFEVQ